MHELQLRQWQSAHRLACLDTLWSINHARQHAPFSPQFAAAAMPGAAPPAPLERHARRSALVAGAAALQVGRHSRISLQALCSSPCKLILLLACCPVPCSQDDLRKQLRGHHNRPQQLRRLLHNLRVRPILQTQLLWRGRVHHDTHLLWRRCGCCCSGYWWRDRDIHRCKARSAAGLPALPSAVCCCAANVNA